MTLSDYKLAPPPPDLKRRIFARIRSERRWRWIWRTAAAAIPLLVAANLLIESSYAPALSERPSRAPEPAQELIDLLGENSRHPLLRHRPLRQGPTRFEIEVPS